MGQWLMCDSNITHCYTPLIPRNDGPQTKKYLKVTNFIEIMTGYLVACFFFQILWHFLTMNFVIFSCFVADIFIFVYLCVWKMQNNLHGNSIATVIFNVNDLRVINIKIIIVSICSSSEISSLWSHIFTIYGLIVDPHYNDQLPVGLN